MSVVKLNRAIQYRAYPTEEQAVLLGKTFGCVRFVWNHMLKDAQRFLDESGAFFVPTPAKYKKDFPFLKEVDKKGNTVQPYPAGDITIALGGSIGAAFVQDREFYTSQNVCVLHTDDPSITGRAKWFVAASITTSCGNYEAFTDELNRHIRTDFIIRLPVNKTDQPDWAYMEEYMRKVEERVKATMGEYEMTVNEVVL